MNARRQEPGSSEHGRLWAEYEAIKRELEIERARYRATLERCGVADEGPRRRGSDRKAGSE